MIARRLGSVLAFVAFSLATGCLDSGRGARAPAAAKERSLLPARVRRLDNREYERTLNALVHGHEKVAELLPPDVRNQGYSPNAAQGVPAAWATRLDRIVLDAAHRAASERLAQIAPCAARATDAGCVRRTVEDLGRHAFRRPLTERERATLMALFAEGGAQHGFSGGLELLLRALLQSPKLVYLSELGAPATPGTVVRLTPYEIASSLAYTVRGGPPDEALYRAAERGELEAAEGRERHARRLLGISGTRHHFRDFLLEWLEVDGLELTAKDPGRFPGYDDLKARMLSETRAFVDEVMVHEGGSIAALLTAGFASVDPPMARFYDLLSYGPRASLGEGPRLGILQQASFLSAHAHEDSTSPVKRGDFVMRKLLCSPFQRPSELGINLVIPPIDPKATTRARFSRHTSDPGCRSCHETLDALGFAFEEFDATGKYRKSEHDKAVDTSGRARLFGEMVSFRDSRELARMLAERPEVEECFARQAFRNFSAQADPAVEASFLDLRNELSEDRADNLIEEVVKFVASDLFVLRRVPPS